MLTVEISAKSTLCLIITVSKGIVKVSESSAALTTDGFCARPRPREGAWHMCYASAICAVLSSDGTSVSLKSDSDFENNEKTVNSLICALNIQLPGHFSSGFH